MKERIYYWDNLKCLLIFFVVLGHFLIPVVKHGRSIQIVYYFIYMFHMPAFVFVSGQFAKYYMRKKVPNIQKLFGFFILFVIFKGMMWGVNSLLEGEFVRFDLFSETGAPWYLFAMFIWYIFLPVFAELKAWAALTLAIGSGLILGFADPIGPFLCLSRIIVFFPFFLAGYYFHDQKIQVLTKVKCRCTAVLFLCILLVLIGLKLDIVTDWQALIYGNRPYMILDNIASGKYVMVVRFLWYLLAFAMTFAVMSLIPQKKVIISYIGSRTLSIYILHRLIRQVFSYYDGYQLISVGGIGLLVFCVVISAIVLWALSGKRTFLLFQSVFKFKYKIFLNKEY